MRNILAIVAFLALGMTFVFAEEFGGRITKIAGDKVTMKKFGKDKTAEEVTLTAAGTVKVFKGTRNPDTKKVEKGDAIADGLKSDLLTKDNSFVRVTTDGDNKITEIIVTEGKKK